MNNKETSASAPAGGTDDRVEMERKAKEAMAKGDFEMARAIAEYYTSFCPDVPDIGRAVELYQHQLALLRILGMNRYAFSWILGCMAKRYGDEGDFRSALATYSEILEIFEKDKSPVKYTLTWGNGHVTEETEDDEPHIASIQHRMAVVHGKMGEYDRAFELFAQVLPVNKSYCEFIGSECNTSDVNRDMGDLEMDRQNYRKALEYYEIALEYEPDKVDSESDHEIRERIRKAKQMMNWTEIYSKKEGE